MIIAESAVVLRHSIDDLEYFIWRIMFAYNQNTKNQ